jgi:hypothetical protein
MNSIEQAHRHRSATVKALLPHLITSMVREGLDDNAISRVLMPITGTTTPAQVRRMKANLNL